MGKVIKAIALVAIAVAVAYFAPYLSAAFSSAFGAAATIAVLSVASTFLTGALTLGPDAPSGYRRPTVQRDATGLHLIEVQPPAPYPEVLQPIEPRSWRYAFFWPGQSRTIVRLRGDCMRGTIHEKSRWVLIDRYAPIHPGDLFAFDLDDMWTAYFQTGRWRWLMRIYGVGMVKRYLGTERAQRRLVFDCTNPPSVCETGFNHVRFAYAAIGTYRSWFAALRASRARLL